VVASDVFLDTYVVPVEDTFADISTKLMGLEVSLPTRDEVWDLIANHRFLKTQEFFDSGYTSMEPSPKPSQPSSPEYLLLEPGLARGPELSPLKHSGYSSMKPSSPEYLLPGPATAEGPEPSLLKRQDQPFRVIDFHTPGGGSSKRRERKSVVASAIRALFRIGRTLW
jgi:hypothetical protein